MNIDDMMRKVVHDLLAEMADKLDSEIMGDIAVIATHEIISQNNPGEFFVHSGE